MTLGVLLDQVVLRWGDRPAVWDGSDRLTYAELVGLGTATVAQIARQTGELHPRIAVVMDNRWEYLALDVGCAAMGAILVRCNARDSADDLTHILSDSQSHAVVHSAEYHDVVDAALQSSGGSDILRIELPAAGDRLARSVFTELGGDAARSHCAEAMPAAHPYRLMYTSGTTGAPKGVIITHDQWRAAVIEYLFLDPLRDVGANACLLHVTPLSHVAGGLFWAFMMTGARQVIAPSTDMLAVAETAAAARATHAFLVPTLVGRMLALSAAARRDLACLQRVYYAGSPIDPERLREAVSTFGSIFAQGYGSTEAMWWLTYLSPEDHAAALVDNDSRRLASCGRPSLGVPIRLIDDEGRMVSSGEIGELATIGRHVAQAYWGMGKVPLIADGPSAGWFRTGDLGYADKQGYVHLMDRKNDLIVSGGFNIYPREVEMALSHHPDVTECCVFGAPDHDWGEVVTAVVVPRAGAALDAAEVVAYGAAVLAGYKKPRHVEIRSSLPITSNGKTDRRSVRSQFWAGHGRAI